jgi:hypothetical protein
MVITTALLIAFAMNAGGCSDEQRFANDDRCLSGSEEGEGGATVFVPRGKSWTSPLMKSLNVFQRKRRLSDRLPMDDCGVSDAIDLSSDPDLPDPPGKALVEESRRALSRLPEGRSLFVVPTSRGGLCAIVTEPGSSVSCGRGSDQPGIGYWNPARGKPYLSAVVPNEVAAIIVRISGHSFRVPVHENAFYFQFEDEIRLGSVGLTVAYGDGSKQQVA